MHILIYIYIYYILLIIWYVLQCIIGFNTLSLGSLGSLCSIHYLAHYKSIQYELV